MPSPAARSGRVGALAYGVRHAVGLRRAGRRDAAGRTLPGRVVDHGGLNRSQLDHGELARKGGPE